MRQFQTYPASWAPADSLQDRDIELLLFLVQTGSVVGAAHGIGMSPRHTRRLVNDLCLRVGAENLYQLVAWAAETGWITNSLPKR